MKENRDLSTEALKQLETFSLLRLMIPSGLQMVLSLFILVITLASEVSYCFRNKVDYWTNYIIFVFLSYSNYSSQYSQYLTLCCILELGLSRFWGCYLLYFGKRSLF